VLLARTQAATGDTSPAPLQRRRRRGHPFLMSFQKAARGEQPRLLFLRDSLAVASCFLDDDFLFLRKKDLGDGVFTGACVQESLVRKKKGDFLRCPRSPGNSSPLSLQAWARLGTRGLEQPPAICLDAPLPRS